MSRKSAKTADGKPSKGHIKAATRKAMKSRTTLRQEFVKLVMMRELRPVWLCLGSVLVLLTYSAVIRMTASPVVRLSTLLIFALIGFLLFRCFMNAFAAMEEEERRLKEELENENQDTNTSTEEKTE